jgi:hypothetical protein
VTTHIVKMSFRLWPGGHHTTLLVFTVPTQWVRERFWKFCDHRGTPTEV